MGVRRSGRAGVSGWVDQEEEEFHKIFLIQKQYLVLYYSKSFRPKKKQKKAKSKKQKKIEKYVEKKRERENQITFT